MSTLTKEWLLKTIAELEEERDAVPGAVNEDAAMALAAMKLALASLEAEKMPSRWRRLRLLGFVGTQITVYLANLLLVQSYTPSRQRRYLFLNGQTSSALEFLSIAFRHAEIKGDLELDDIRLGVKMANGSRAAMLQEISNEQ